MTRTSYCDRSPCRTRAAFSSRVGVPSGDAMRIWRKLKGSVIQGASAGGFPPMRSFGQTKPFEFSNMTAPRNLPWSLFSNGQGLADKAHDLGPLSILIAASCRAAASMVANSDAFCRGLKRTANMPAVSERSRNLMSLCAVIMIVGMWKPLRVS